MINGSMSISLGGSGLAAVLLFLILVGTSILFYRITIPPLPPRSRFILAFLRSLALCSILALLFEPNIRFSRVDQQDPRIALLVDDSQSMTIRDAAGDRRLLLRGFLEADHFSGLPGGAIVMPYFFSSTLRPAGENVLDSLRLDGETTDLSEAVTALEEEIVKENIQAVVLVSDGNSTIGRNPAYGAEALGIPVYTVGIGDTIEQRDLLVENVVTNSIAFARSRVPVDITVRSSGYGGENIEVTLAEGTSAVDRRLLILQTGTREYVVRLFVVPADEGVKKLTARVSQLPGELTERNNARSFYMKVLKDKIRVLLVAGSPAPDVSAVQQVLREDERLAVRSFVQKSANTWYGGEISRSIVDSADCLVLIGYPAAVSGGAVLQEIQEAVVERKKPLLIVNGQSTDYAKLQLLGPALPYQWSAIGGGEILVSPFVPERTKRHPLVNLGEGITPAVWEELPPVYKVQMTMNAKAESEVLAAVRMQQVVVDEPLVLVRNIGRQKTFAVTGYGIWRWRLMVRGDENTENFLPTLLTSAIRWLTTGDEDRNVRVVTTKESYTTAEAVAFSGQVYDEQLRPVDGADVSVELRRGGDSFQIKLDDIGNGRYEGSMVGLGEGDFTFIGRATVDGRALGQASGRFTVGQMNVEFIETRMNKPLLEQMAYATGGKFYDARDAELLGDDLRRLTFTSKELVQATEIEIWNWHYLAGMIVFLLAAEWFLRKRKGML